MGVVDYFPFEGANNTYDIKADGTYNIQFDPAKEQDGFGWFEGCILVTTPSGTPLGPDLYIDFLTEFLDTTYKLTLGDDGYYHYDGLELTTTSQFKVVSSADGIEKDEYYPDGIGNEYGADGEIKYNGTYNVTFRPDGEGDEAEGWFEGYFLVELVSLEPMFRYHSMVLNAEIGLRFELVLPEDFEAEEGAAVEFRVKDGREESVALSSVMPDEDGCLWFTCPINAMELADTITATFAYGDGKEITDTYSAVEYFADIKEAYPNDTDLHALVDALQDMGYFMQHSGWKDSDGNGGYREGHDEIDLSTDHADFDENIMIDLAMGYADQFDELDFSELDSFKIEDVKFSVTLNAATRINLFLKCPVLETEYNDEISFGGESYFWIQGNEIKASQLLESYTFHIETDLGEVDIAISPMQYMFIMLNNEELEDNQKAALAAFVCYAFAANDYVQSH